MKFNSIIAMNVFFGIIIFGLGFRILFDGQYVLSLLCLFITMVTIKHIRVEQQRVNEVTRKYG